MNLFNLLTPLIGKILWYLKDMGYQFTPEEENKLFNDLLDSNKEIIQRLMKGGLAKGRAEC